MRTVLLSLWLVACGWLGCALPGSAWASTADHITERAWLDDPGGRLRWPEVREQPVQVFEGVLSQGFGSSVVWVRLRIDPDIRPQSSREPRQLILRIRPVYLDDIQVFDPLLANGLAGVTGDWHHPRAQNFEGQDFLLPIARGQAPREVWLRLASTSTRQLSVQALRFDDLQRLTHTQQIVFALYIGVILIFMVWGGVYWVFSRETVIGAFGLKQAAALLYALLSLGYARVYWPAAWPAQALDTASSVFSCLAVGTAVYFHVVLLREFGLPGWLRWLHRVLLLLLPIKMVLLLTGMTTLALRINMHEVLLAPLVFLLSAWLARGWQAGADLPRPLLPRWVVLGFYAALCLILLLASLPGLGLAQGGEIPLYVVQAHGLVTAFLVLLILQYRAHVQQKHQADTALALQRSYLQVQQERNVREEQAKLLAMLTHELRTPLATMQMRLDPQATGSQAVKNAIRDMNAVIERCVQTIQLDDRQLQAQRTPVNLPGLVDEVVSACTQPERVHTLQPATLPLETDRQLLFIALSNLLENACKYAAPGSPITLEVRRDTGQVLIRLCNEPGPAGRPDANKVFEKYYRSPHARRQAGTGLGLYLVRNLAEVMGGQLRYCPTHAQVCFELTLPAGAAAQ